MLDVCHHMPRFAVAMFVNHFGTNQASMVLSLKSWELNIQNTNQKTQTQITELQTATAILNSRILLDFLLKNTTTVASKKQKHRDFAETIATSAKQLQCFLQKHTKETPWCVENNGIVFPSCASCSAWLDSSMAVSAAARKESHWKEAMKASFFEATKQRSKGWW